MKVRVVIEYEIPAIDVLTDDDVQMIEQSVWEGAPQSFSSPDGAWLSAAGWTVEVQR